jgi:hypothetical protein
MSSANRRQRPCNGEESDADLPGDKDHAEARQEGDHVQPARGTATSASWRSGYRSDGTHPRPTVADAEEWPRLTFSSSAASSCEARFASFAATIGALATLPGSAATWSATTTRSHQPRHPSPALPPGPLAAALPPFPLPPG